MSETKPIIVLGSGGHAKVVIDTLRMMGKIVTGIATVDLKEGSDFLGIPVVGGDKAVYGHIPDKIELVNGIGALPGKNRRWHLGDRFRERGFQFLTIIHPSAVVADDVRLEEGVHIMAGAVLQAGSFVGRDTIINTGAILDHDCKVKRKCHLSPGVCLSGNVTVEKSTHLGTGTSVTQGILIGSNTTIAAGSAVYKNVPDNVVFIQKREPFIRKRI